MSNATEIRERYNGLADDELARIALAGDLIPEAEAVLNEVLKKRGLRDLSAFKKNLDDALEWKQPARQMEFQAAVHRQVAEWTLVVVAWVGAIVAPSILILRPRDTDGLKAVLVLSLLIVSSCGLGIRARREGAPVGFFLKLTLPLILLGVSSVVALAYRLHG